MKRLIVLLGLLAALMAATTGSAQALSQPTCGSGGGSETGNVFILGFSHSGPPTKWSSDITADCGNGATFNWFIQHSGDNFQTWQTVASQQIGPTSANNDFYHLTNTTLSATCAGRPSVYRIKVNTATDSKTLDWDPPCL